ncbi:MAG: glucose-6-phosphate dehydrogenase [Chloroflexota bacterium]
MVNPVNLLAENPLREGLDETNVPVAATIVIFGVTGDLAARKLSSALYNLAHDNLLPQPYTVVGVGRRDWTDEKLRDEMSKDVAKFSRTGINDTVWSGFAESMFYQQVQFDKVEDYHKLGERLDQLDRERGTQANRLFYLAIPPDLYSEVAGFLGESGLNKSDGYTRIIIEKPLGKDLDSARVLNQNLRKVYQEDQIYRIDHYLGKETVQNIAVFRFANAIFEPLWNRNYIDNIQITVAETVSVESRGQYYDESGAMRDIIQNHVLQVLSLVAMEPPAVWNAMDIHDEKVKLLRAIRPIDPSEVGQYSVRGQYSEGSVEGKQVKAYLQSDEIAPNSTTETYVALKLLIDNWRWADVPFYLRTGKALPKRVTEVALKFRNTPLTLFGKAAGTPTPNRLILRIQPDEGITIRFDAKLPGQAVKLREVNMDFRYGTSFGVPTPEAYERLLLDALLGDSKLFARDDEVDVAWVLMTRFLEGWAAQGITKLPQYPAGSWGPTEADEWIEQDGRSWRRL